MMIYWGFKKLRLKQFHKFPNQQILVSEGTTYAFLDRVLSKFGFQANIPIAQGMRF